MNILFARNADFDVVEANKIQVIKMCKAFTENKCKVTLLAFGKNVDQIKERHRIDNSFKTDFIRRKIRFFILGHLTLFVVFLRKYRNITNIFTRDILFAYLVKKYFKDKKVFLEIHDVPNKSWWRFLYIKISGKLDCVVVISRGLKDALIKLGLDEKNMIILQDGVDLSEFDIPVPKRSARKKLGLPLEKPIIIYAGSTKEERDLPAFIEAAKKMPNIFFVVYGKEQPYLLKATKEVPNFSFKGFTTHPELAYKASDILFAGYTSQVSTINYMSPLKIFEYLAAKRPIIAADFPRIREVLGEKEVYFYKSGNSDSLKEQIRNILNDESEARKKIGNAFKKAQKYTWQKRTSKIINLMK